MERNYIKKAQSQEGDIFRENIEDAIQLKIIGQIYNDEKRIANRAKAKRLKENYEKLKKIEALTNLFVPKKPVWEWSHFLIET